MTGDPIVLNNKTSKKNIRDCAKGELESFLHSVGEPPYRASQIDQWLWQKNISSFEQMTNLSLQLRSVLKENFDLNSLDIHSSQHSNDRTIKYSIRLPDNCLIEAVLIPVDNRVTACISSQVGCSLDCTFCATAKMKRIRNLSKWELYQQVFILQHMSIQHYQMPLTNVVFMGMGEPLMNFKNVVNCLQMISSPHGLMMSPWRVTVSTSGIPKLIRKLADQQLGIRLAVSLHSANQEIREKIMPFSKRFPLDELLESLIYWYNKTKQKVTFEYLVLRDINDTHQDIDQLLEYCKRVPSKVNFIEYNPVEGDDFQQADPSVLELYKKTLKRGRIHSTFRSSRGSDIDAACGQLANKLASKSSNSI